MKFLRELFDLIADYPFVTAVIGIVIIRVCQAIFN